MTTGTYGYYQEAYKRGLTTVAVSESEMHILLSAFWVTIYEPFIHDYTWEQLEEHCWLVCRMFDWYQVFVTIDFSEQRKRMTICEKRIGELEMLIAKIYEDNALGKLSDKRNTILYNQYEGEQEQLQSELDGYKTEQAQYEKDRKSAAPFLKLVERYSNAEEMSMVMLNEFVEKIIVHKRDRKGSTDTTQKIEIYFNFIGEYIPPTMVEKEPTLEELEKMRKKKRERTD